MIVCVCFRCGICGILFFLCVNLLFILKVCLLWFGICKIRFCCLRAVRIIGCFVGILRLVRLFLSFL